MAERTMDIIAPPSQDAEENSAARDGRSARAGLGATVTLTVTLVFGTMLTLIALVWVIDQPYTRAGYLQYAGDQNQSAKTALYVVAFAVVLPLALVAVPRLTAALAAGPNAAALGLLAAILAGALSVALLAVKLSGALPWHDGANVLLVAMALWWIAAGGVLARATRPREWPALLRRTGSAGTATAIVAALVFGTVLCAGNLHTLDLFGLALGALAVAAVVAVYASRSLPRLRRPWGPAVDVVLIGLVLLAVPDMVVVMPKTVGVPSLFDDTGVIMFHHDVLLGATNQLLAGGALLVNDPVSQYGVGSVYFLAGWFQIAPIGHGTYGLLDGILTALVYASAYCVLRIAGVSRLLAGSALAVGVVAFVYNLAYPIGALPQQGPLRFGLPMAAVLATVAGVRWPRASTAARAATFVVLGVSAVWALEGFAYTLLTVLSMLCLLAVLRPAGDRLRWLGKQLGLAAAACVAAHLILAGATLAGTGELPHWHQYLIYVREFLLGGTAGAITYGFENWSPGAALAGLYLASAAAIVLFVRMRPGRVVHDRVSFVALTGMTAYGVALFSYADNRSATYLLLYVSLPALVTGALWLSLLLRSSASRAHRLGGLAFGAGLAAVLVAVAWPAVGGRFDRSALGHIPPAGHGLRASLQRLWHMPALDARTPEGERLVRTYLPPDRRIVVLTTPDLGTEIMMRTGRANKLPLGEPLEESFVASSRLPDLRKAIAGLRPGERVLMDQSTWRALTLLRARRDLDPLLQSVPGLPTRLQGWVLERLNERFRIVPIYSDRQGFIVAQLEPRR